MAYPGYGAPQPGGYPGGVSLEAALNKWHFQKGTAL